MDYSDDESEEDFQFDVAPRYVVPSYSRELYSSQNLARGAENDDVNDGWDSDDERCMPTVTYQQGGR